jgi:hypothetical protein
MDFSLGRPGKSGESPMTRSDVSGALFNEPYCF